MANVNHLGGYEMMGSAIGQDDTSEIKREDDMREMEKPGGGLEMRMDMGVNLEQSHTPDFPALGPILVIGGCGYEFLLLTPLPSKAIFSPQIINLTSPVSSDPTSYTPSSATQNQDLSPSSPGHHTTTSTKGPPTSQATYQAKYACENCSSRSNPG